MRVRVRVRVGVNPLHAEPLLMACILYVPLCHRCNEPSSMFLHVLLVFGPLWEIVLQQIRCNQTEEEEGIVATEKCGCESSFVGGDRYDRNCCKWCCISF